MSPYLRRDVEATVVKSELVKDRGVIALIIETERHHIGPFSTQEPHEAFAAMVLVPAASQLPVGTKVRISIEAGQLEH